MILVPLIIFFCISPLSPKMIVSLYRILQVSVFSQLKNEMTHIFPFTFFKHFGQQAVYRLVFQSLEALNISACHSLILLKMFSKSY